MSPPNSVHEYVLDAYKAAPPVTITGATVAGLPLQDWVYLVTIVYTVLMIAQLAYKFVNRNK